MERNQFTFYASFYKAASYIPRAAERARLFDAICRYGLWGEEPDPAGLGVNATMAWQLIVPVLESGRKKAEAGRRGNDVRWHGAKKEGERAEACDELSHGKAIPCDEKNHRKNKKEIELENEAEIEDEDDSPRPGSVADEFCRRVNPRPSPRCREELREFEAVLGREVCLRAMDEAADAGKRSWAYIRGILRAKQEQGVRSLADWDRQEQARRAGKAGGGRPVPANRIGTVPGVVNTAPDRQALEDMERMRRYLERMKQEG